MIMALPDPLPANDPKMPLKIFPLLICPEGHHGDPGHESVFITFGAGETQVSIVDDEGKWIRGWTAIFGWSVLCTLPFRHHERDLIFEEEAIVARALTGSLPIHGELVETHRFIEMSKRLVRSRFAEILDRTVGSAISFDRIVLAGPEWSYGILAYCCDLRPHVMSDVKFT